MIVCKHCAEAIWSRGEKFGTWPLDYDDPRINEYDEIMCEWCEEIFDSSECVEIEF